MVSFFTTKKLPWLIALLAGFATVLTLNNYSLFWGVEFVFGMSVALATLFLKKGPFGLVITLPVAIATYFMWGRPYGGIAFILEILVLTLIRNSPFGEKSLREGTILIYDFIYWATIGAPFYYLAYFYLAHQANETSLILAQKSIVNGVINSLIAYIIYAAITMTANNRSNHNQSVSIQALALATIYSVIVFVSLFMADMLYGSVLDLKANSLYKEVEPFSSFILKNTYGESLGRIDTELDYNLQLSDSDIFFKEKKSSEEIRISKGALQHKNFNKNYELATSKSRISKVLHNVGKKEGASINLYLPKKEIEQKRLGRYLNSLWEFKFHENGKTIRIICPAKNDFLESGRFFERVFPIINSTILAGIILSIIISYSLGKEFLTVLGKSKKRKLYTCENREFRSLESSPIIEIANFAKEINRRTDQVNQAKEQIEELNKLAQQQLSTAGEIQQAFLGDSSDIGKQPDVSLFMRPALNAGGDWYDAFDLDNKTFIIVADVCDKGVGAALFMSVFRSLIRYAAENWCAEPSDTEPLDVVIASVNDYMSTEHEDMSMFATVFIACISHPVQRLDYVLAGHEEPIFLNSKGEQQRLEVTGPAIGLFQQAQYTMRSLNFDEGSILVGYSDGVIDARDPVGKSYGHQRLLELVRNKQKERVSAQVLKEKILSDLEDHMKHAEQFDDITIATVIL